MEKDTPSMLDLYAELNKVCKLVDVLDDDDRVYVLMELAQRTREAVTDEVLACLSRCVRLPTLTARNRLMDKVAYVLTKWRWHGSERRIVPWLQGVIGAVVAWFKLGDVSDRVGWLDQWTLMHDIYWSDTPQLGAAYIPHGALRQPRHDEWL